jgi:hypothetical protein
MSTKEGASKSSDVCNVIVMLKIKKGEMHVRYRENKLIHMFYWKTPEENSCWRV